MKKESVLILCVLIFSAFTCCSQNRKQQNQDDINYFELSNQTLGDSRTFSIASGDIDLDGDQDLMIANYVGPSYLCLNNGDGKFKFSNQRFNVSETHNVGIADLNGDNYPDIVLVCQASNNKIYFNNGDLTFTESDQNIGDGLSEAPCEIYIDDIDNDNDLDILIYNFEADDRLWLNNGNGIFELSDSNLGGDNCKGYQLADFNGDNYPDLFLRMRSLPNQIWLNDKTGSFINDGHTFGNSGNDADAVDFDNDGDTDLVIADNGGVTVWLNQNNSGTFVQGYRIEEEAQHCKVIDANGDGYSDIITLHYMSNGNKLWINDGKNSFQAYGKEFGKSRSFYIELVDIENDGDKDLVFGQMERTGGNSIFINNTIK